MGPGTTPMRWPAAWRDPAAVRLLAGSGIDCILGGPGAAPDTSGVRIIEGEWPGIRVSERGAGHIDAGPTGEPWVDSNGWRIRLEKALEPGAPVWVEAKPKGGAFALAVADAAAHGGRWIVNLPEDLAEAIARGDARALAAWKSLTAATAFFAARTEWSSYEPRAVIGVISDFSGGNEFLSRELLNLLARANQQCKPILKGGAPPGWKGLRAVIYPDVESPSTGLRAAMLAFAESGGLIIAGPKWGAMPAARPAPEEHPRYDVRSLGKGRIAVAKSDPEDPYEMANDAVVLVSHRYELLRFWNTGAVGSHLSVSADGHHTVAHLLFYADQGPADAAVRVAGTYKAAALRTLDRPESRPLELHYVSGGAELHLPRVNQYAALELEV